MPDGTSVVGGKLAFGRPLRLNDSGVYECVVKNSVGVGKTEHMLTVAGKCKTFQLCSWLRSHRIKMRICPAIVCFVGILEGGNERTETLNDDTS